MNNRLHCARLQAAALALLVAAGAEASGPEGLGVPLADHELANLRGGFVGLDNLEITIGLEQRVAVDGQTLILNRLTIPNLNQVVDAGRITARVEQALANAMPAGNAAIVIPAAADNAAAGSGSSGLPASGGASRNSPAQSANPATQPASGLSVSSNMNAGHWMTVIQNRFNGRAIQNMQQLNIELNNLGAVYRLPQGIRDAMPVLP